MVSSAKARVVGPGGDGGYGLGVGGDGVGGPGGAGGEVRHQVAGLPHTDLDADVSLFWHFASQSATAKCCGHQQQ
jgi:hypothetical protein